MEKRIQTLKNVRADLTKGAALPIDFTKMICEVMTTHFDEALKLLNERKGTYEFYCDGMVYPDEIVLAISLREKGSIASSTLYASCDFDPTASQPSAEEVLNEAVDVLGGAYEALLNTKNPADLERFTAGGLSALEDAPFEWTKSVTPSKHEFYLKIDKANLEVDKLTEEWLKKNDPAYKDFLEGEADVNQEMFGDILKGRKTTSH